MRRVLIPLLLAAILAAAPVHATDPATAPGAEADTLTVTAECNPPCGPIPVVINLKVAKWKGLTFGDQDELTFEGTVTFYVNVDQDGWWYDAQNPPLMSFRVNREPPWVKTSIEPAEYVVPVQDPTYLSNEGGAPNEVQFFWDAPFTITVRRLADPTLEDLSPESPYIRRDGTFRITTSATTTSSLVGGEVLGPNVGLQEGYGVRELRFIPEIDGVAWVMNEQGQLVPQNGALPAQAEGEAPAPMVPVLAVTLFAAAAWVRFRRTR